jgi:hypothetical protein
MENILFVLIIVVYFAIIIKYIQKGIARIIICVILKIAKYVEQCLNAFNVSLDITQKKINVKKSALKGVICVQQMKHVIPV